MLGPCGLEETDCQNKKENTINIIIRFLDLIIDYEFDQSS